MANNPILLNDEHSNETNPWNKPVVGWKTNSQGIGGMNNAGAGFGLIRVVHQNDDGKPMYDQPVLVENAGAIVLPRVGKRIGLIKAWRLTGERIADVGANYIKILEEEGRWDELARSLGAWQWEAPRGLAPSSVEGEDLEAYILRTAKLEAAEEAGFTVENARIVGRVNTNTTFFAHAQYVVSADVVEIGNNKPEDLEVIGNVRFFTLEELRELNMKGEFVCGLTLSAMTLCGLAL